jgi:hypothetical protein
MREMTMADKGHCIAVDTGHVPAVANDDLTPQLREALENVEQTIEDLNAALRKAVEAGATVELRRRGRVHSDEGCWADQMSPLVLTTQH